MLQLREIVPPSKATLAAAAGNEHVANSEARRPKHVVLADTIALLKTVRAHRPCDHEARGPHQVTAAAACPVQLNAKAPLAALLSAPSLILGSDQGVPMYIGAAARGAGVWP